jgi:hypothetical protein
VRRVRRALLTVLLLALLAPAAAHADGDPASDVLLAQDVFLPYPPNRVSGQVEEALTTTLARAKAKGFPVKVALIADPRDLGSVGQMFGTPQKYADLLTQELSLNVTHGRGLAKPRVLTVQPAGLGGNNLGDDAGAALEGLAPAEDEGADGLARTAAVAVGKLAAAAGRPIAMPELPGAGTAAGDDGGGGVPAFVLFGAPVLLVVLAVVALNLRMGKPEDAPADEPVPG